MIRWYIKYILLFIFIVNLKYSYSQINQIGIPNIKNYYPFEYGANPQNFSVLQDEHGIFYFGNLWGILEFDSKYWRFISLPKSSSALSLALGQNGIIYVGGRGEFGYLKTDSSGYHQYHSLSNQLNHNDAGFNEIWDIYIANNQIYFCSFEAVFILNNNHITVIKPQKSFEYAFLLNNTVYINQIGIGLCKIENEKLSLVPSGDFFCDKRILAMLPFNENQILLANQLNGFFLYDGKKFSPWKNEASDFLSIHKVFKGLVYNNQYFIFGTSLNGIVIIDKQGNVIQHINKSKGLPSNDIINIYLDNTNNLWQVSHKGISNIQISSPFSLYNDAVGINGIGRSSTLFNNKIYLSTTQGVFFTNRNFDNKFIPVKNSTGEAWNLCVIDNHLFCAHNEGAMIIKDTEAEFINRNIGTWLFLKLKNYPDYILSGTYNGLYVYEKKNNKWTVRNHIKGFNESSRFVVEDNFGDVWISHGNKGLFKLRINYTLDSILEIKSFTEKDGLPNMYDNYVFKIGNEIWIATINGVYCYDNKSGKIVRHEEINKLLSSYRIDRIYEDVDKNLWIISNHNIITFLKLSKEKKYHLEKNITKFQNRLVGSFEHLNPISQGTILISTQDGFVHYNLKNDNLNTLKFSTLIREIKYTTDSTYNLFGGKYIDNKNNQVPSQYTKSIPKLNFSTKSILFKFTSNFYEENQSSLYQFYLEGFDKNKKWSDWTERTEKEYTNLPSGKFTFHVRSKNCFGQISEIASYSFEILPPWYKTRWAYSIGIIAVLLGLWLFYKYFLFLLQRQHKRLEAEKQHKLWLQQKYFEEENLKAEKEIIKLKQEKLEDEITAIEQKRIISEKEEELRNEQLKAEQEIYKLQQEKLLVEVQHKNKELASLTLHNSHKNEILIKIKDEILTIIQTLKNTILSNSLQKIINFIDQDLNLDEDWKQFESHFDEINENFLKRLKEKYPDLKPAYIKLCVYIRMNLTSKQIAALMNTTLASVEKNRYRLKEKLNMEEGVKLTEFIQKF